MPMIYHYNPSCTYMTAKELVGRMNKQLLPKDKINVFYIYWLIAKTDAIKWYVTKTFRDGKKANAYPIENLQKYYLAMKGPREPRRWKGTEKYVTYKDYCEYMGIPFDRLDISPRPSESPFPERKKKSEEASESSVRSRYEDMMRSIDPEFDDD